MDIFFFNLLAAQKNWEETSHLPSTLDSKAQGEPITAIYDVA